jgi:hypothetical protein
MAFKPNYRRDRLERDRAARARSEEKQKKKEERTAQRKSEQAASEVPSEGEKDWWVGFWPVSAAARILVAFIVAEVHGIAPHAIRGAFRKN